MGKQTRTQACPECGSGMRYEKHDDVLEYKGHKRTIKTLGWWCSRGDEAILTGAALLAHERAFQQFKAEVDDVMGPDEVANVRARLERRTVENHKKIDPLSTWQSKRSTARSPRDLLGSRTGSEMPDGYEIDDQALESQSDVYEAGSVSPWTAPPYAKTVRVLARASA